ncbi:MAG: putative colanic acid biosynthesis acetyltransferase [Bacteroidales bacterium]|jgi:putative colanic acid biosynthesis acetyltransferase WcaF|nr:putative colanic acid biosynthesis acetyltransferase [Bacteroidales bacterium]
MNEKRYLGHVTLSVKVRRAMWNIAAAVLFRPFGTKLFRLWRLALLRAFGAQVSWRSEVYASARVWAPWNLVMADGATLGPDVICYNQARVVLMADVCVSQYAYLCTAGHDLKRESGASANVPHNNARTGLVVADIVLEKGAWVGTQAFIGMGVTVGEGAVVGARANVFKDVPPQSVAYAAVGHCAGL